MKKPIIAGPVLLILLATALVILLTSTQWLLPRKFKDRYDTSVLNRNEKNEYIEDTSEDEYSEPERSQTPLFKDNIDLSYMQVSEPASYKNLQVCLIYGRGDLDKKKYITLNHALKNKLATVHETEEVNELSMDNHSDEYIYINSGDIVKGGKQDRTIQYDVVIGPHEKGVDLASFCVESGRWSQRGNEESVGFRSSEKMISSNDLKLAAKHDKNQSKVWAEVEEYQEQTTTNVNSSYAYVTPVVVKDSISESSLELTLENKEITRIQAEYRNKLLLQMKNQPDAIGLAYFMNGKLYGIDIYNNHRLFTDLFNKLFDAAIAEAISLYDAKKPVANANTSAITQLFAADAQVYTDEEVNKYTQFRSSEHNTVKNVMIFTCLDKQEKNWLHRNWLNNTGI